MRKGLNDYFNYSQNEKRGVLVLIVLIVLGMLFPKAYDHFQPEHTIDLSAFDSEINKFVRLKEKNEPSKDIQINLFAFDPNALDKAGFLELGLNEKVVNTILNYRNSGGKFKKANDLKKIYGLADEEFMRIKPYIKIESPKVELASASHDQLIEPFTEVSKIEPTEKSLQIDLNMADSALLTTVNGIGPAYAKRIINYRAYLGGYNSTQQLKEVYGITNEIFISIKASFKVDSLRLSQININKATFKDLNKHPYISYKQTKAIFKYRDLMGGFDNVDELLTNSLIDTLTYQKVKPYLSIN